MGWQAGRGALQRLRERVSGSGPDPADSPAPHDETQTPPPSSPPHIPGQSEPANAPLDSESERSAEQEAGYDAAALSDALGEQGSERSVGVGATPVEVPPTSGEPPVARRLSLADRIHDWIPIAIVTVSVLAAIMGWRASLAEEGATHSDELSRQDLVGQQTSLLNALQGVDSDIRAFGLFAEYSVLGHSLLSDAGSVGGTEGQALAREGQGDIELARSIGSQIAYDGDYNPTNPSDYYSANNKTGSLEPDGSYRPGNPYRVSASLTAALSGDRELTSLEPDLLRSQARNSRKKGVDLVGLAALFISGLVFFTLGAVSRGPRTIWFASCGVLVALVGVILFPVVQLG